MNIVIVGAGRVGRALSEKLSRDGHDVSLIDQSADKVREISETLDVQVLCGNGSTAPELRRAGIENADLVVAVTNRDEINMVVGVLASFAFEVPRIIVRLREAAHAEGLAVYVYTVDAELDMRRLLALGVDGLFTNFPARLRGLLDSPRGSGVFPNN